MKEGRLLIPRLMQAKPFIPSSLSVSFLGRMKATGEKGRKRGGGDGIQPETTKRRRVTKEGRQVVWKEGKMALPSSWISQEKRRKGTTRLLLLEKLTSSASGNKFFPVDDAPDEEDGDDDDDDEWDADSDERFGINTTTSSGSPIDVRGKEGDQTKNRREGREREEANQRLNLFSYSSNFGDLLPPDDDFPFPSFCSSITNLRQ